MPRKKAETAPELTQPETTEKAAKKSAPLLKKAAPKKEKAEPAKKAPSLLKKEKVEEVYLQVGSEEWNVSACKEQAIEAYKAQGHRVSSVKKLVVYLKPEEGKAYYVVNGDVTGSIDL